MNIEFDNKKFLFYDSLKAHYDEYINSVSGPFSVLSWKALNKIAGAIIYRHKEEIHKPMSHIIDMGSGFSSVMLRLLKQTEQIPNQTNIFTVDHSDFWLGKTIEYCEQKKLPKETFILWDDFYEVLPDWIKFNVIIFDIGYTQERPRYFEFVLKSMIGPKSATDLWLDDMHKPDLRSKLLSMINQKTKAHRITEFSQEKEETTGRYIALVDNILL